MVICVDNYLFVSMFSINLLICSVFVVNSTRGHHQLITHQDPLLEVLSSFFASHHHTHLAKEENSQSARKVKHHYDTMSLQSQ